LLQGGQAARAIMPTQDHALAPLPLLRGPDRLRLLPGTLWRLGPRALLAYARHRLNHGAARKTLADRGGAVDTASPWFDGVPPEHRARHALDVPTGADFDIRAVWEQGRLADAGAAQAEDFLRANPPFRGPHWACGQETAIRLAHLLHQGCVPDAAVAAHRDRILATLPYAIAQDNNHAISEAAGLWAAGLALDDAASASRGRALLERAVLRLFAPSGGFAQHALRYQALALELAGFAVRRARAAGAADLSRPALARLAAGTAWLARLVDRETGAAWRVGHDDSSALFGSLPQDLRPVLARAAASFGEPPAPPAFWLDEAGGFAGLHDGPVRVFMRLPVHRFRPSQADALHLDLWQGPRNLLRDAGTATYNFHAHPDAPDLARTAAHNTVSFDDDDQMPRLSRFLYAAWLEPRAMAASAGRLRGAYRDWRGRTHDRQVEFSGRQVLVRDDFDGRFDRAILRWRLAEGDWRLDGSTLRGPGAAVRIDGAAGLRLSRLPFAPCYGAWRTAPALEAWADRPGTMVTIITLQ
jgi:hypothetical protein